MDEQTLREILERTTRIETKLDNYELLREKADKAYSMALHNEEAIKEIKSNNKWAWGYMIALGLGVVSYFLTKGIGG
ncbi:hemolysin XhlA family protein [Lactococcus garvieae]|uniref:hemolysin XhlA family protein n=1 Tax=Lactococcus garvieae TaxID=1363 RepID=UPI0022E2C02D|nr:hemolysin XhlA family protein [Lactococcus garvieae]